ncbi:MAG: hypothetical protein JW839_00630 [Candidatus Lokiarchaeota archaeon]|nr:hypothetical protein [Candidatus Lokiarchaeota archaeon]
MAFGTCELLVIATGSQLLERITYSLVTGFFFLCWLRFFVHSTCTHVNSFAEVLIISIAAGLGVLAWHPSGEISGAIFFLASYVYPVIISVMTVYWAAITLGGSPWFARAPSALLIVATTMLMTSNLIYPIIPYEVSGLLITAGSGIIGGVIIKHPGIVSFLPYRARYIVLLDRTTGGVLFEQSWAAKKGPPSASAENDRKNLISLMERIDRLDGGAKVAAKGLDFDMDDVLFHVNESSEHFIVGLVARRSSRAFRDGVSAFARQVDEIIDQGGARDHATVHNRISAILRSGMLNVNALA